MRSYTNSGPFVRINKSILTNPSYTDAGAAPFYYYQVLAVNDLGEGPPCASVRTTPTFPIQINCGDSNNDAAPFLPDQLFQNLYGSNNQPTGSTGNTIDTSSVTNPAPQAVYQTYRNDPIGITYTFPNLPTTGTTGAAYTLRQHFAADGGIYALSTFDILVNGTKFRSSYYPAAAAYNDPHSSTPGQYEAVTLACNTIADSNGNIVVTLNETYVRAYCNGIELYAGTLPTIITTPTGLKTTGVIPNVNCYTLAQIRDRVGNSIYFNYTPAPTGFHWPLLASISTGPNGTGTVLLTIQRSSDGAGNITAVSDAYGRSIYYNVQNYLNYSIASGFQQSYQELQAISQIVKTATANAPIRYNFAYQLLGNGQSPEQVRFLHTITVPSPTGTGSSTATINYTPNTCMVSSLVDGNGNQHVYSYPDSAHTQVAIKTSTNVTVYSYTAGFDTNMSETTITNGAGVVMLTRSYNSSSADPFRPTAITDGNGNTWQFTWDQFSNVLTVTRPSPRNTVITYSYDYSVFPLGELKSIQEGAKSPTTYQYYEPSGLIKQVTRPLPGTTGSSSTVTYSATYNSLGDPLTITTPGNNSTSSITTTFNYGSTPAVGEPLAISDNLGKTMSFAYDNLGLPSSSTDQANNTTTMDHDLAGLPISITFPATGETGPGSSAISFDYLFMGGPLLSATTYDENNQAVRQVTLKYGKEGEMLSRSGSMDPVTYTYDALYRISTLADGAGHKTTYSYNPAGYLASIKYPKGDTTKFTAYDPLGNMLTRVDGRNITTKYVYNDPENLLTNIIYPADPGHNVTFGYDAYGRRSGIADGTGVQIINYDDDNLITSVKTTYNGLAAQTIAYSYYPDASRQGMSTPAGAFTYGYDGNGLLASLTNPFNETTHYSYTDNRLPKTVTLPNGITTSYGYDQRSRPTDLTNATASSSVLSNFTSMAYDAASNRTSMTASMPAVPTDGGLTTYQYDSKNELSQEQSARAGGYTNSFVYDAAENPTTFRGAANTFNTDNQFTNTGYGYDGAGNPTTYQGVRMSFDEENRLTSVGSTFAADYTGEGLRAWKQGSGGSTYFLYDGTFPVCELDASGNVQAVNTNSSNGLVSRRTNSSDVFYTFDPQGNVAQRLDASGNVLSSSVYDGFGANKASSSSSDPFGFGAQFGYYTDGETGLQLLTHRYYDAGTGRFLTRDPISYTGGINLYAYVQNRALIAHDPNGSCTDWEGVYNLLAAADALISAGIFGGVYFGFLVANFWNPLGWGFAIASGLAWLTSAIAHFMPKPCHS